MEKLQELGKGARESEQQAESSRDKYSFIVKRLKADIRFLIHSLQEFVDPPEGMWDPRIPAMEKDMEVLTDAVAAENGLTSIDPIASLLNYRDKIISQLLDGLLFEKAVLNLDLKSQLDLNGQLAQEPAMADMDKFVAGVASKSGGLPAKYHLPECPNINDVGPFTYDPKRRGPKATDAAGGAASEGTPLQSRLLAALREMQQLDRALRHLRFGAQMVVPDKRSPHGPGRSIASDEMRKEITKLFDKCCLKEHELQMNKAQRHESWEVQEKQVEIRFEEKKSQLKQQQDKASELDSKVQSLTSELDAIRREKKELDEKNQKMANENLPALDRIGLELKGSREAVDRLHADAETLSSMFRLQVDENKKFREERDQISKELTKVHRQLKRERDEGQFKDDELQKKETLYRCTVEARKTTLEGYQAHKNVIREVEEKMRQQEAEFEAMRKLVEGRDDTIQELKQHLQHAHAGIEYLEQQKKFCLQEFKTKFGTHYSMLLEQFKEKS